MISDGWFRPKERDAEDMNLDLNAGIMSSSQLVDDGVVISHEMVKSPKVGFSNNDPTPPLP